MTYPAGGRVQYKFGLAGKLCKKLNEKAQPHAKASSKGRIRAVLLAAASVANPLNPVGFMTCQGHIASPIQFLSTSCMWGGREQ